MLSRKSVFIIAISVLLVLAGCKSRKNSSSTNLSSTTPTEETGVEKVKPAPGTGNVQGKVFYNSKPAANIDVKLCETFNRFFGGCDGKTYTAKTDNDGIYVITNVPPKTYETLLAKVFDTDSSIFATTGIAGISAAKYEVVADKTLFVQPVHLFKSDLKLLNPKAGEKVSTNGLELKWQAYPDAAYYKFNVNANDHMVTTPYINKRVDGTSFSLDTPLQKGVYRWQVAAYNSDDRKLAESADDIEFTITDGQ
ncbi:MAG TPA: hypothetical protein VI306_03805 [Pyrinomonadaceae bacterium]